MLHNSITKHGLKGRETHLQITEVHHSAQNCSISVLTVTQNESHWYLATFTFKVTHYCTNF